MYPFYNEWPRFLHFLRSPAVPPHQILVYDASGRDVAGAVGPLLEGDNIVLTCEVRGGK